jgi:hypothetical protein
MILKSHLPALLFLLFFICQTQSNVQGQTHPKLSIDISKKGVKVSPTQSGLFFEDINHAADGGLYAELIRNRSFEDAITPDFWTVITQAGAIANCSC